MRAVGSDNEAMSDAPNPATPPAEPLTAFGRILSTRMDLGFIDFAVNRATGAIALVGVIAAIALPPTGLGITTCTMLATVGVPCPGCGLTRSVTSIYHGYLLAAWQLNPFGFAFALAFASLAPVTFLPSSQMEKLKARLRPHSRAIAVILIVLVSGLMIHGIVRGVMVGTKSPVYAWWWDGSQVPPAFQHLVEEGQTAD